MRAAVAYLSPWFLYTRAFLAHSGTSRELAGSLVFSPLSASWFEKQSDDDDALHLDEWAYIDGKDNPDYRGASWNPATMFAYGVEELGAAIGLSSRNTPWLPNPGVPWAVFPDSSSRFDVDAAWGRILAAGDSAPLAQLGRAIYEACSTLAAHDGGALLLNEWRGPWPPGFQLDGATGAYVVLTASGGLNVFPWPSGRTLDVPALEPILAAAVAEQYAMDPQARAALSIRNAADGGAPAASIVGALVGEVGDRLSGKTPWIDAEKTWRYIFGSEPPREAVSTFGSVLKFAGWLFAAWIGVRLIEAVRR